MDPKGVGTVSIELNRTAAELLARMCVELGTDQAGSVVAQSLGLLDMCMRTKRQGGRLCFINEHGESSDVVF